MPDLPLGVTVKETADAYIITQTITIPKSSKTRGGSRIILKGLGRIVSSETCLIEISGYRLLWDVLAERWRGEPVRKADGSE